MRRFGSMYMVGLIFTMGLAVMVVKAQDEVALEQEEIQIRKVVQLYFDGIIEYDEAKLREAFHQDAIVSGTDSRGILDSQPFQTWVLYTRGKAPDATGRENTIVSVDISGHAASVKTDLSWPHVHYVDYLSFLKLNGKWVIVNKIWYKEKPGM